MICPTTSSAINSLLLRRNTHASWNLLSTGVDIGKEFGEFRSDNVTDLEKDFAVATVPGSKLASVIAGNFLGITNLLERPSASSRTL